MENRIEELHGHLFAMCLTLQAVIQHLPPAMAKHCADTLMISMQVQDEADDPQGETETAAAARNAMAHALHGLLTAAARRG